MVLLLVTVYMYWLENSAHFECNMFGPKVYSVCSRIVGQPGTWRNHSNRVGAGYTTCFPRVLEAGPVDSPLRWRLHFQKQHLNGQARTEHVHTPDTDYFHFDARLCMICHTYKPC
eukprot:scpid88975/ scgid27195/ 